VCAQVQHPSPGDRDDANLGPDPLGIPPQETLLGLQTDVAKELVNKIAWTLGSVYRKNYSNMHTPARQYAWRIVKQVIKDHGYPAKISKQ